MRRVEILAPAGSYESLKAAVYAGCDAVYAGGSRFGARAFANNLEEKEMLEAIDFVHLHGKKIYLTVNTLFKEQELEELYGYLKPYYEQGLDAAIVQDVGALSYIHQHFPSLPIHASTQMFLTGGEGALLLKELGVTRAVPARELSLEEIQSLKKTAKDDGYPIEIETFVHGALCYCYSGQCLLSSMIGGRSGNRGRCAQPCRMPYALNGSMGDAPYLLSPKDICAVSLIPQLIQAGVGSFKIEGRMKGPEYTAYATYVYGKYTDLFLELGEEGYAAYLGSHREEQEREIQNLMELYNRGGFTEGYYRQRHGRGMMSLQRPSHHGVLVGRVARAKGMEAEIVLSQDISPQDVLEFRNEKGQGLYDYTVKDGKRKGDRAKAKYRPGSKIHPGNLVFRTRNERLLEEIRHRFLVNGRKLPIEGKLEASVGKPLALTLTDCQRNISVRAEGALVEKAKSQPMEEQKLLASIDKISNTEFVFEKLAALVEGEVFAPVGKLKELRREAQRLLEEAILKEYRRPGGQAGQPEGADAAWKGREPARISFSREESELGCPEFFVTAWNREQVEAACQVKEVRRIALALEGDSRKEAEEVGQLVHKAGKEFYGSLPYVSRFHNCDTILSKYSSKMEGFLVRNMEQAGMLRKACPEKNLVLDANVYTLNSQAQEFWRQLGICEYTTSVELNAREISLCQNGKSSLIVYGRLPLMLSAQCLLDQTGGCQKHKSAKEGFPVLTDRKGKEYFAVSRCESCYQIIYDGQAVSLGREWGKIKKMGHKFLRLDFTVETKKQTEEILSYFLEGFCGNKKMGDLPGTGKGHFCRGIE